MAETIGHSIQKSFDNKQINNCKVKRKGLLVLLSSLEKVNKGLGTEVRVDSNIMFNRLVTIA